MLAGTVAPAFLRLPGFCSLSRAHGVTISCGKIWPREHRMRVGNRHLFKFIPVVLAAFLQPTVQAGPAAEDLDFFETEVRPLLVAHCSECHSGPPADAEGGLSFDTRAAFQAAQGVAVAGNPQDSLLVEVVHYDSELQMPPDGKLPEAAIAVIEEWVRRGLPWPEDGSEVIASSFDLAARKQAHWCWQPPCAVESPSVANTTWARQNLDRFVLARLEGAGLSPAAEATASQLVRRAAEVLTGLPPNPADVARVASDADPNAFEHYVDELLASPHFGERFARHWLDVVRYGETRGHEFDYPIPNAWQYRDWVVRAFNADLPYDQFVREQIAGDLLPEPRLSATGGDESVLGTGFWLLGEEVHSPVDIRQDEADRMDNRVDTFGKAFLGRALGCARCHDHKFDALSNEDYYAIAGMVKSSSYRQVAFESLPANRQVIAQLTAAEAAAQPSFRQRVEKLLNGHLDTAPDSTASDSEHPAAETVIADYTRGADSTPLTGDPAWEMVLPGDIRITPVANAERPRISVAAIGHAHSDPMWATTRTTGERDPGPLGGVDRAGRVLRTPQHRITNGVLWHRVRGHVQIFVAVDSHVLLQGGPIYGSHAITVDTGGEWQWIKQDMRKDLDWSSGHTVHVEYAAVAGPLDVAETVASLEQPSRLEPTVATQANAVLTGAAIDWTSTAAAELLDAAAAHAQTRAAILAAARLESASAPALLDGNGFDWHVLLKGSAARPGDPAPRRFLEAIDGDQQPAWPDNSSGRLLLAERVLDPANPLTSRVIVNRVWHHLFGRGLVPTTDNFGVLGEAAADPIAQALLDTLAVQFREEGWSLKQLIRKIVTSSTWRMSTARDPLAVEQDPLNLLMHHYPLRRLEGEAIRDSMLAISGRLDPTIGGPSVEVFIAPYHEGRGRPGSGPLDGAGRRSLYTKVRRNFLPSMLIAFDMPVPFQARGRRNVTNVPAQALTLMNDPFVTEQAGLWAKRILADESLTTNTRIEQMYREAFAREPDEAEQAAAMVFLENQTALHGGSFGSSPNQEAAWSDLAHALFNAKEFVFLP